MAVSVDVKFVVKSTNEHLYHRTVYSYSKADWDGLRVHLKDMPWLDIFRHDVNYADREITQWVEIGIDCYIPRRKFQLKSHSSPWFTPNASKATGPTEFQPLSSRCSPELSPVHAKLYNKCLIECCFPSCWKSSSAVPVYKNDGERSDPGKYCHVSL